MRHQERRDPERRDLIGWTHVWRCIGNRRQQNGSDQIQWSFHVEGPDEKPATPITIRDSWNSYKGE